MKPLRIRWPGKTIGRGRASEGRGVRKLLDTHDQRVGESLAPGWDTQSSQQQEEGLAKSDCAQSKLLSAFRAVVGNMQRRWLKNGIRQKQNKTSMSIQLS